MSLNDRLALAAMRAIAAELEGDPAGAGEVLARLFGGAPAARSDDDAAELGREMFVVAAAGGNDDEPERPARRRKRPSRASAAVPRTKKPAATKGGPEARRQAERLVERHGTTRAAGKASGVQEQMLRRYLQGKCSAWAAVLERLRAALDGDDDEPVDDRDHKPENVTTEAAQLVARIEARHGGRQAAASRFGFNPSVLGRWAGGVARLAQALERLRAAAGADPIPAWRRTRGQANADVDQGEDGKADERREPTEAARLVSDLLDRHETIAAAAKATGLGEAHLRSWSQDGPINHPAGARAAARGGAGGDPRRGLGRGCGRGRRRRRGGSPLTSRLRTSRGRWSRTGGRRRSPPRYWA